MKEEIKEILELYKNDDIEYYNLVSDLGYDKLLDYITNLQEENELLTKVRYSLDRVELERRIDKAIEYIERCRDYHRDIHKEEKIFPDEITSLLMILQGEDKQ